MKSDSAVSVVVAFVIILAVISVIVGVWALFGIPGQLHAAGEAAVSESESAFTDYKIKLEALQNSDTRMVNLSVLMPMGGAASSGTLRVEKAGGLGVINATESLSSDYLTGGAKLIEIHRLVSDVGLRGTQVGFEANGIFRNDNGMASWSVPLNLTLWNDTGEKPGGQLYVRLNAATITGSLDVGGTGSIPLNTYYTGDNVTVNTTNRTQSLVYATENEWDANLWYSQFYEALEEFKAGNKFPANTTAEISRSSLSGLHLVWMNITTLNGGEEMHTLEVHTPVYNAQAVEGYIVVAPAYHIIQASAGDNGKISPSGSVRVREGS
ncbi:MAG: hypothetical protein Q4Q04_05850, partial [Methanocorpusculum sp.]|nr:hypothetical protein [Methanocorpusculum sp.]